jgi:hypothetical protein
MSRETGENRLVHRDRIETTMIDIDTKIAVISTTCLEVPPSGYGGLELIRTVQGRGAYDNLEVLVAHLQRVVDGDHRFPGPAELRAAVEKQFSVEQMTDVYLQRARDVFDGGW